MSKRTHSGGLSAARQQLPEDDAGLVELELSPVGAAESSPRPSGGGNNDAILPAPLSLSQPASLEPANAMASGTAAAGARPRCRPRLRLRAAVRRCVESATETCRTEGFLLRNVDSPLQVEMYLVCSAVTILLIRVGLYATGYPQLGGNGIHIAHMLWGGLLMSASQMLSMCFLGRNTRRLAAILGGVGFGTFIDELGKFITSDNNYFYKPTPFLLYTGFCALFIVLKCVEPLFSPSRFSEAENLANALNLLSVYSTAGLSKESKLLLIELLAQSDQDHPVVRPLRSYVQLPVSASGISTSREHHYLRFRSWISARYAAAVRNRYTTYVINAFFTLQCVAQIFDLSYLLLDGSYYPSDGNAGAFGGGGHSGGGGGGSGAGGSTDNDRNGGGGDFLEHFLASPFMKYVREVWSGKISDTLLLEEKDKITLLHIFQLLAVSVSALCVLCGVYHLSSAYRCGPRGPGSGGYRGDMDEVRFSPLGPAHGHAHSHAHAHGRTGPQQALWNRRMKAFVWFRRSMLVRLFITDSLSLYHAQFLAFGDVIFTLFVVGALSFMITQEESTERLRRLSVSGSIDEATLT